jgi:UDP-N-acetylmuramate dehydrogenase
MKDGDFKRIEENVSGSVLVGEPLANHTTYKVGGRAECLVCPDSSEGAGWIYSLAKKESIPLTVLGAGSNVIAPDAGIRGIVLKLRNKSAPIEFPGGNRIVADAGVSLIDLARAAAGNGLRGFEPIAGIPGTVGGAVFMNAGTKEGDTGSLLEEVEVLSGNGKKRSYSADELSFGYRTSAFQKTDWLILRSVFRLEKGSPELISECIEKIFAERQEKYPLDSPNAGSVFKRPPGDYAGRLIEEAGCKGLTVGGASVSTRHANFIINAGGATASDIVELISIMRRRVYDMSGIYLELENEILDPHTGI